MKLIDKAAVVAEIRKRLLPVIRDKHYDEWEEGQDSERIAILDIIDTLDVKEVDFERELSKYVSNGIHRFFPKADDDYCKMDSVIWQDYVIETAKHFFELGIKAQKGK